MKAILFVGGWEGHSPTEFGEWCRDILQGEGFEVEVFDSLAPLAEPEKLADVDLIVPVWSSARSSHQAEFGNMTKAEEDGLLKLIAEDAGLAAGMVIWAMHFAIGRPIIF